MDNYTMIPALNTEAVIRRVKAGETFKVRVQAWGRQTGLEQPKAHALVSMQDGTLVELRNFLEETEGLELHGMVSYP